MSVMTDKKSKDQGGFGETIRVVIHALILALIVRTFLFQPFNIPSGSMMPTLLIGDYLFVSKYSYGYSRYSFPFGPDLFSGRIWASQPDRGDVVVFKLPRDTSTDYIKRVIGMPGDNRDNSTDSRFLSHVGYVPFENFVGRAEVIYFSIDENTSIWEVWKWPTDLRWDRLFDVVR